jgi:glutathione S-transferase
LPPKRIPPMLQVLGRASSINVRKVLWTCAELNLDREHIEWGTGALLLAAPDFLALNPNGLVPVVRDDAVTLWESNTICRYLAAKQARTDLLPQALAARARVEQWMDWQATELNTAWRYAFMALVRQDKQFQDRSQIDASVATWNRLMRILDETLAKNGPFLTGSMFTLADVVVGLSAHRWYSTPMERPTFIAVESYYERLSERPGFVAYGRNGLP